MAPRNTPGVGNDYEVYVPAFFALTLNQNPQIEDFQLRSNVSGFGNLDDLIIDVKTSGKEELCFAFQLKHKEKEPHHLHPGNFTASLKNDFCLARYAKTFKSFKDKKKMYHLILYTNGNFDPKRVKNVTDFKMTENNSCPGQTLFNTNSSLKSTYKFEVNEKTEDEEDVTIEDYKCFFQQFSLYTNQKNVMDFEKDIYEILKFPQVASSYISLFRRWHQGFFTNKTMDRRTVNIHLIDFSLHSFILTERYLSTETNKETSLFEMAIKKSDITAINGTRHDISCLKINFAKSVKSTEGDMMRLGKDIKLIDKYKTDLHPEDKIKIHFYIFEEPIFVDFNKHSEKFIYQAIEMCRLNENNLKLVLICQGENVNISKLANLTVFQNLSDLFKIDKQLYQDIIRKCQLSIQGKKKISLESLFKSTDNVGGIEIETREIIQMLKNNYCSVGENQEKLPETYIPREVSVPLYSINIFLDYFLTTGDILILDNNNLHLIQDILTQKRIQTVEMSDYLLKHRPASKNIILTSKNEFRKSLFVQISADNRTRNVHFVKIVDEHFFLLLLTTNANIDQIKPIKGYIEEKCIHTVLNGPINLLCSNPGMGKSVMLKYLRNTCESDLWTVAVELKTYNKFFKKKPKLEEIVFKFLDDNEEKSLTDKVKRALVKKKKVVFFFDGLDELEFECVDHVLELVGKLSSEGYRVWMSSRKNLEMTIQNRLNVLSIDIEDFNESQQRDYIARRRKEEYSEEQIKKVEENITRIFNSTNIDRKLLGIPLQMFILTQILLHDTHKDKVLKADFFVLTKMYRYFFEGKYNSLTTKRGYDNNQLDLDTLEGRLMKYEVVALQTCFGEDMLRQMQLDLQPTQTFLEDVERRGDPLGIISKIVDDVIVFEHHTYAEYFACVFFSKNFEKVRLIQDCFFSEKYHNLRTMFNILLAEECPLHLAVINQNLEEIKKYIDDERIFDKGVRNPLQLAIMNCKKFEYKSFCNLTIDFYIEDYEDYLDSFKENETINKEVLILVSKFDLFQKDDLFGWNSLEYCVAFNSLLPIEIFLRQSVHSKKISSFLYKNFGKDEIAYFASRFSCPKLLSNLLSNRSLLLQFFFLSKNIFELRVGNTRDTLLHLAVKPSRHDITENNEETDDEVQVVKILVDAGVELQATNRYGMTAMDWAFLRHRQKTLELLLEKNARLNFERDVNHTTLFQAARDGNLELVDFLVYRGNDLNASDNNGATALDIAIKNRKYRVIGHLLQRGAELNISAEKQNFLLRKAIEKKSMKLLTLLLDKNRSLITMDENQDILFLAARYFDSKIMRFLVQKGAEVNGRNEDGDTLLHVAARNCQFEMINLLVEMDADINAKNAQGNTPLHVVCLLNLDKCPILKVLREGLQQQINTTIKMLLVNKADIYARNNLDRHPLDLAIEDGHLLAVIEGKNMRQEEVADKTIVPKWIENAVMPIVMFSYYICIFTWFFKKVDVLSIIPYIISSGICIYIYRLVPGAFSIASYRRYLVTSVCFLVLIYCYIYYKIENSTVPP